jgi:bifunctional enzyme CysN/CysC
MGTGGRQGGRRDPGDRRPGRRTGKLEAARLSPVHTGVRQLAVLVNKMDLVQFDEAVFRRIKEEYDDSLFLAEIDVRPLATIPVSGFCGDNIARPAGSRMPWYRGNTVLEQLDAFQSAAPAEDKPFRMPVQGVYKFTNSGDDRRIVAGSVDSGSVGAGDEIVFYPSGKKTRVKTLETFNAPTPDRLGAGSHCGFPMTDQIYIRRRSPGQSRRAKPHFPPGFRAITSGTPVAAGPDKRYVLKQGTARAGLRRKR